jgi:pre-rRNA-processing protein TSR1
MSAPGHHHRSTTKQSKKGFKSRHATKSSLKEQSKGMGRLPIPTCNF